MISLRNAVWRVTDFGLETADQDGQPYRIPQHSLLEVDQESFVPVYWFPTVVAGAPDVDLEDFLNAWRKAVEKHFGPDRIDRRVLLDSVKEMKSVAERVRRTQKDKTEISWVDLPEPDPVPLFPETAPRSYPSLEGPEHPSQEEPE